MAESKVGTTPWFCEVARTICVVDDSAVGNDSATGVSFGDIKPSICLRSLMGVGNSSQASERCDIDDMKLSFDTGESVQ